MTEKKTETTSTPTQFPTSEDWKIQVNKKINGDLWNIRAASPEEFASLTEGLAKVGDEALNNLGAFVQVVLARNVQTEEAASKPTENRAPSTRKASRGGIPECAHGPMKDLSAKNYRYKYYCPESDRDKQCPPQN